jgi:ribosomal protein S18 acetylase RimI-like enzyme
MKIVRATARNIDDISRLFDRYRQFYDCEPDLTLAVQYISDRIKHEESVIFVALGDDDIARGFVQLYPSFCSIETRKIIILHDLYVDADYRKMGIGESLMIRASDYAREVGASRLDLLTAVTNKPGQALYEKLGYKKVLENFYAYSLAV